MNANFLAQLKPFSDFSLIGDATYFSAVPEDYVIVISDIKDSTIAAQKGLSKQVNMVGAAVITIVSNHIGNLNTLSVFGGDGATLILPQKDFEELKPQFIGLIQLANKQFNLILRIGAVKASDLYTKNFELRIGRYHASKNTDFAQFTGQGFSEAERMIKSNDPLAILLNEHAQFTPPNLSGLSCRMDKFPSQKGLIMSLLVKPRHLKDSLWIRTELLNSLQKILNGDFASANPITNNSLNWKLIPETLRDEIKFQKRKTFDFIGITLKILLANLMLKFNIAAGGFLPSKYKSEIPSQSDFKKFDDCLRMVVDCTNKQEMQINDLLTHAFEQNKIYYGIYTSKAAVSTCVTFTASAGEHIHFVDGEGCGYTMASIQLKQQMKLNPD